MRRITRVLSNGTKALDLLLDRAGTTLQRLGSVRFLNAIEPLLVVTAIVAFSLDLSVRQEERDARAWQLVLTKVSGNSGKVEALEHLNNEFAFGLLNWLPIVSKKTNLQGVNLTPVEFEKRPLEPSSTPIVNRQIVCKDNIVYLKKLELKNAVMVDAILNCADLEDSIFSNSKLTSVKLAWANLVRADFSNTDLSHANLKNAILKEAVFSGADLSNANFETANLQGAKFKNNSRFWNKNKFSKFHKTNFSGAQFKNPDFENSSLKGAIFTGTFLGSATFKNADLSNAIFTSTSLNHADFENANLSGALLRQTLGLTQEQLNRACIDLQGTPPTLPADLDSPPRKKGCITYKH